jgi:hypothetical protein
VQHDLLYYKSSAPKYGAIKIEPAMAKWVPNAIIKNTIGLLLLLRQLHLHPTFLPKMQCLMKRIFVVDDSLEIPEVINTIEKGYEVHTLIKRIINFS